jgi:hypothetical protein
MCLTPWPEQYPRYMAPLTPFLALALVVVLLAGRDLICRHFSGAWKKVGIAALMIPPVLVLACNLYVLQHEYRRLIRDKAGMFFYDETWRAYDTSMAWLKDRVRPGEVVATSVPHWFYIWTGRQAVMPPMELDPVKGQDLLDSVPVKYLIIDELKFLDVGRLYTEPVVSQYANRWELIHGSAKTTRIYRRKD